MDNNERDVGSSVNPSANDETTVLDARGLTCPEPLMLARNAMRTLSAGDALEILATDPSTVRDFSNFCRFMGHEMLVQEQDAAIGEFRFVLRKAG